MVVSTDGLLGDAECQCECCQVWRKWSNELLDEIAVIVEQHQFDSDEAASKILVLVGKQ